MRNAIINTAKEFVRWAIFALISAALAHLSQLPQTDTVIIGTLVLRGIDKFLHNLGKETGNNNLIKGLSRV